MSLINHDFVSKIRFLFLEMLLINIYICFNFIDRGSCFIILLTIIVLLLLLVLLLLIIL